MASQWTEEACLAVRICRWDAILLLSRGGWTDVKALSHKSAYDVKTPTQRCQAKDVLSDGRALRQRCEVTLEFLKWGAKWSGGYMG